MDQTNLTTLLLDQSKNLFWMIDQDLQLIYANKRYLSSVEKVIGKVPKLNESAFIAEFGADYIEKWSAYYKRALNGDFFEVEDHYFNPETNEIQYGQTAFEPLKGDDEKVFAVACQSKDITRIIKQRSEYNQLIDASLDVFCTVNEEGNFVYVSSAAAVHWGYLPEELI